MHISQLFIYPVKSLRGIEIDAAVLTPQGLQYDRQWMIINDKDMFVTQRKYAQMVLIHTEIKDRQLILSKPSEPTISPLSIDMDDIPSSPEITATVWKDQCQVLDEGEPASLWLSRVLDSPSPLRLVRMADTARPQSKPDLLGESTHTYFADAAPFLLTNSESLGQVNKQLESLEYQHVPMENFRPNIVVDGLGAFEEHKIPGIQHPNYQLKHCYPCQRCVIPTINIATGERHSAQQPFSCIAAINPMPENPKAPAFGENAVLLKGEGETIRVGDVISVHK